jgi:cell division protein FtsQ
LTKKRTYRKWVIITVWVLGIVGIAGLLGLSKQYYQDRTIKKLIVNLQGKAANNYVDEVEIKNRIKRIYPGLGTGAKIGSINTKMIEKVLVNDLWITKAEVFFNNENNLIINITQTQPVARVFTTNGNSYYVDTLKNWLPITDKAAQRLPVFTNYPVNAKGLPSKDSVLQQAIAIMGSVYVADSFWQAQMAQVNINNQQLTMVPSFGKHLVQLGAPVDVEKKLSKLKKFYCQFAAQHNLNSYDIILAQYDKQVVGVKKGQIANRMVDSLGIRSSMHVWDSSQNNSVLASPIIEETVDGSADPIPNLVLPRGTNVPAPRSSNVIPARRPVNNNINRTNTTSNRNNNNNRTQQTRNNRTTNNSQRTTVRNN